MLIKVVSFNIHHGTDTNNQPSLDRILTLLQQIKADIINLQEVDMLRPSTGEQKQASFLAQRLGMRFIYGAVREYAQGSYGNAILSRYAITSSRNIILADSKDIRYCLQADIRTHNQTISIFNTHLGLSQPARYKHLVDIILPDILSVNNPALLAGDFNAPPSNPEITMVNNFLTDTFIKNSGIQINTFSANNPTARIDYIFVNEYITPLDYYIIDTDVSDHLPVVAKVEI